MIDAMGYVLMFIVIFGALPPILIMIWKTMLDEFRGKRR